MSIPYAKSDVGRERVMTRQAGIRVHGGGYPNFGVDDPEEDKDLRAPAIKTWIMDAEARLSELSSGS